MENAILLISCPDAKGIVAKISNFIYQNNGNIVHSDQHTDPQTNTFFMRVEWSLEDFKIEKNKIAEKFSGLAEELKAKWKVHFSSEIPRMTIFVSKYLHCVYDLLPRYRAGQFKCEIPFMISNYPDAKKAADSFGIKFYEFSITRENKLEQERKQIELLKRENIELIVLARYSQILTKQFVDEFPNRIISIHHSFLPAFVGKDPHQQAYRRGVKIIGATSHFVIEELDAGPIIEQDILRVSHRDSVEDFMRKGEDLEKGVLARSIKWYLDRKILVYDNKTVIFD